MDKVLKVVRIDVNNKCSLIDYKSGDKINGQNKDHETLFALESEGLKLGMFGMEWTLDKEPPLDMIKKWDIEARNYIRPDINKLATKLLYKLKYPHKNIDNYIIRGTVIIYDDDTDMTIDKWNKIKKYIKNN